MSETKGQTIYKLNQRIKELEKENKEIKKATRYTFPRISYLVRRAT